VPGACRNYDSIIILNLVFHIIKDRLSFTLFNTDELIEIMHFFADLLPLEDSRVPGFK
jgi:hypothetical protein